MWKIKKRYLLIGIIYLMLFFYFVISFTFLINELAKNTLPGFYQIIVVVLFVPILLISDFLVERTLIFPFLKPGIHNQNSLQGFIFGIHVFLSSFSLFLVHFILPTKVKTVIYKMAGAKIGKGTEIGGLLGDPFLVKIGNNSIISSNTGIVAHTIQSKTIKLEEVEIGNNVIINDSTIIFSGVKIGDNSELLGKSIVKQGTIIPKNQVWGGIPAKFIKNIK